MSKIRNPLSPNPVSRNVELYARLEVMWGGLGDLVHETSGGAHDTSLDYFLMGTTTTTQEGIAEDTRLQFTRKTMAACWITPEKSNDTVVGHNRNYALRFCDDYIYRSGPIGNIQSQIKVTTELLVGRWATLGAQQLEGESVVLSVDDMPDNTELVEYLDLNTVLDNNIKRFEEKKSSYQAFRDKARNLQSLDIGGVLQEGERSVSGDVIVDGVSLQGVIDDIRNSANSSNSTRLTIQSDCTLWRRAQLPPNEHIDKA